MGEDSQSDAKSKTRRFRNRIVGRRDNALTHKSSNHKAKYGRTTSFNAGDAENGSAAAKAAAEGYDPMGLLRAVKPAISGPVQVQKTNSKMKMFSKWEDHWAEVRGNFVLLYAERPAEKKWKLVDITGLVRSMFCVSGCVMSHEKKKEFVLRLSKYDESVHLKFESSSVYEGWEQALTGPTKTEVPRLSDFEIIAPIGKGAAGKVFLVKHKKTGRQMALKAVEKEANVFDSRSSYRHALDERIVLGLTVGHPSFVQLRYAFQTGRNIYLVTEFCDGGDLFFYLAANQCGLDEDRAKFILAEILLALERLHELDVIYRDLKPENILLDAAGHIRIADFGLCKRLEKGVRFGRTGTICGTHSYVAPEMISAKSYGASVDIFTVGVFLYHIMVGRPPFDASDMDDVKANVKRLDEIEYYDDFMSKEAIAFLKRLLTMDPEKRLGCSNKASNTEHGVAELRSDPFFASVDWDHLKNKTGPHKGGLFTGGFEIPPGMESVLSPRDENSDPNASKSDNQPWYKTEETDTSHLLRNFDLSEWEGVSMDDKDDSGNFGDARMWPVFKFHKRDLPDGYIVGYSYAVGQ